MWFKGFFYFFSFGGHFVQWSGTILAILVVSPKEHFCKIILESVHWPRKRCRLKFFIFSFGGHFVQQSNFGRGPPKEQSHQLWLKSQGFFFGCALC